MIGSSPLCLVHAIDLAERGAHVTVFDGHPRYGGAWRTEHIEDGQVEVEIACHLIENHRGAYERLSRASGVAFDVLSPQPVKLFHDGRETLYSDRRTILREAFKNLRFTVAMVLSVIHDFGIANMKPLRQMTWKDRRLVLRDLRRFMRYRLPKVITGAAICHPRGGGHLRC